MAREPRVGIAYGKPLNVRAALAEAQRKAVDKGEAAIKTATKALAKRMRDGDSSWPVRSGRSRRGFIAVDEGIANRQWYSLPVEIRRGNPAKKFVEKNIESEAQKALDN